MTELENRAIDLKQELQDKGMPLLKNSSFCEEKKLNNKFYSGTKGSLSKWVFSSGFVNIF